MAENCHHNIDPWPLVALIFLVTHLAPNELKRKKCYVTVSAESISFPNRYFSDEGRSSDDRFFDVSKELQCSVRTLAALLLLLETLKTLVMIT
jgi:hypothetical protein